MWCVLVTASLTIFFLGVFSAPTSQEENVVVEDMYRGTNPPFSPRPGRDVSDELNEKLVDDNNDSDMENICRPPKCII
ncbi:hypothetical protein J6590_017475 [Homalodisca vitripennis]|nr:hypothetical protein J6590_017475 [Homalodisca vitripennis]